MTKSERDEGRRELDPGDKSRMGRLIAGIRTGVDPFGVHETVDMDLWQECLEAEIGWAKRIARAEGFREGWRAHKDGRDDLGKQYNAS